MIDLKAAREKTKGTTNISQADIAQHLGITQGQVSKYEASPETVPSGMLFMWFKFLGIDLASALSQSK